MWSVSVFRSDSIMCKSACWEEGLKSIATVTKEGCAQFECADITWVYAPIRIKQHSNCGDTRWFLGYRQPYLIQPHPLSHDEEGFLIVRPVINDTWRCLFKTLCIFSASNRFPIQYKTKLWSHIKQTCLRPLLKWVETDYMNLATASLANGKGDFKAHNLKTS